ncbi:Pyridoxal-dependent decarboxylase domain-containing protein 1 [Holothuria leucospilota]|uniref:Pyridoxal-dependent decarboxylase domain-containing protein 1 n=1 Tax=Holothuria leucospilota TaxID=206669 RepID=A0A9Q1C2S1_HOLLE|nr:Pyridoxal-dependent decarboxylase domain-containing protein 1 [Holothuria leucospilota]
MFSLLGLVTGEPELQMYDLDSNRSSETSSDSSIFTSDEDLSSSQMSVNSDSDDISPKDVQMTSLIDESIEAENKLNGFVDEIVIEETLRKLQQEREEEFQAWHNKVTARNLPGPIADSGQKLEDIIQQLEKIIVHGDEDNTTEYPRPPLMQNLDKTAHLAMLGQSIIAYLSILDSSHVRRLTTRIISDTTLWLSRLFRFDDSSAYYHMDDREGLVRVCRLALSSKYEKFSAEGFNALYAKPPIIYISAASRSGLGQFICSQLGLPLSSLCTVPCNTMFGSQHTMDIASLERLIKDDIASSKTPLLVVANVGTPMAGHTDNLSRLRTICDENSIWLHVNGHNLATLSLSTVPSSVLAAKRVNSMTIHPGTWLALPGSPAVTLYKTADPALSLAAGLMSSQPQERLCALPIWLGVQSLGYNGIINRLTHAASLSQHLSQRLNSLGAINLTDKKEKPKKEIKLEGSLKEVVAQAIQVFAQTDTVSPVVVFKFDDSREAPGPDFAPYAENTTEVDDQKDSSKLSRELLNSFNKWLGTELGRRVPNVALEVVEGEQEGVCLKFSPLQSAPYHGTNSEDIDHLMEELKDVLDNLDFTIKQRKTFRELVESKENLHYIENDSHAGLGAVQFIPDYLKKEDSEAGRKELTSVNSDIIQRLQIGEEQLPVSAVSGEKDTVSVGVGVVNPGTNIEEIIEAAWTIGKELEDSSKFLESMSEIIRKGIEEAERQLEKENENKLMEEGVLRQIPLMSSLINWLSPPPKDAVIKGRTLNLSSGELASTETTYNLKMQLFKEDEEKPLHTPEQTAVTSGNEDGEGNKDEEVAEEGEEEDEEEQEPPEKEAEEETPSTTPNGPVAGNTPKSILKKKDLEESKEEATEEGEDNKHAALSCYLSSPSSPSSPLLQEEYTYKVFGSSVWGRRDTRGGRDLRREGNCVSLKKVFADTQFQKMRQSQDMYSISEVTTESTPDVEAAQETEPEGEMEGAGDLK